MYAVKTTDQDMGTPGGVGCDLNVANAAKFLNESPRNALVIGRGIRPDKDYVPNNRQVAVFCGAAETPDNYYYQQLPLEEPDADGGHLTAEQAVMEALELVRSL